MGNMSSLSSLLGGGSGGRSRQAAATVPVPAPAPGGAGSGGSGGSTGSSANPAIQLSDLQSILSNMQVPAGAGEGSGGAAVDLSTGLTGEALQPLLQNQEFLDKVKEFLPAGEEGKEVTLSDLSGTVQSPQFQQAVSMFSMALSSGQLGPLIKEFGLGEEAAAAASKGDMGAFVKALQKEKEGDDKDKDKQEDMALD